MKPQLPRLNSEEKRLIGAPKYEMNGGPWKPLESGSSYMSEVQTLSEQAYVHENESHRQVQ